MREVANYVMRGPKQAALLAFCGALIPMMFWLSAAVIGLVTLRQGIQQGLVIFVWPVIPALGWWVGWQDPGALIVMLTTLVMAAVLRYSVSWQRTLISGVAMTIVVGLVVPIFAPELIEMLMTLAEEVFREMAINAQVEYDADVKSGFQSIMVASFAATFFAFALGALFLARSWQAHLYNPGGWQSEFHQMRLNPLSASALLLMAMVAPSAGVDFVLVMMVITIPAIVCGLALVHGVIAKKKLGGQWLFGFYVSMFLFLFPTGLVVLVIVAYIDSLIDFRKRVQTVEM